MSRPPMHASTTSRPWILLPAFGLLAVLPGCWSYSAGRPAALSATPIATTTIAPDAWPPRDPELVRPLLDATPGWVYSVCLADAAAEPESLDTVVRDYLTTPEYTVEHCGMHGLGLIRVYQKGKTGDEFSRFLNAAFDQLLTGFPPNASFVSSRTFGDKPVNPFARPDRRYERENNSLRARGEPYEWQSPEEDAYLTSGVDLRFPPVSVSTPRGLILHLQSIAGNDYEPRVLNYLRDRGWSIIDIKTATHVSPPVPGSDLPRIDAAAKKVAELDQRIADRNRAIKSFGGKVPSWRSDPLVRERSKLANEVSRLRAGSYQVDPACDLEPVAKQIATDIDQTLAGNAYAVEAVLDYVRKQRQDLLGGPVVLMGFSAGALAAPTVVARLRDQIDAVVMVGGGADLFMLAQNSEFTDGGVTVRHGDDRLPPETISRLDALYLKYSRLDPYHTATTLRGMPVLQIDATMDTWVPTPGNDLLYERLGRPDRLRAHLAGHMMLFYFLPSQSERIADWLEVNTAAKARRP